ncbi:MULTISPECIES: baseplate J/gp47 family protein [Calothrix]|uniref:Baseplate J/gp47 family protein n=2 Tax=Calothrix TaxID=1186 RepID=A0ABR8AH61_9CYAN|nr:MULTISPECIES: baseplate J/gp47 family protein [Calothrix]MBD2199392.1 baseplate J/gp47 family protein [Calothrix parietina FACHB-288]MBD2228068.1 baseplate J/gp47 family protein [Calothrix anomala FACHB-343]
MSIRPNLPKNPLIRDGVSQRQRQLLALSPDYVKIDAGDLADFLVFAHKLSQQVHYYSLEKQKDGNWEDFFTSSTPIQIALISKTQPEKVKAKYQQNLPAFIENQSVATLQPILDLWKSELLTPIANWYEHLESYTPLKAIIQGLVKTNLQEPLRRMQSFERNQGLEGTFYTDFEKVLGLDLNADSPGDRTRFNDTSEPRAEIDAVFQMLFQTYRQIIQEAPQYLKASLTDRQDHPPHLALYFAFWEVMQPARDDFNRMTQRHLDFFYRQVLYLRDRPAQPDRVHLILELAKTQTEYKLAAATPFPAGKDASGVDIFYQLDAETVFHQAAIASLQGLFLDSQEIATGDIPQNLLGLYASPIANSFDGKGGDFPKDQVVKTWRPFGDRTRNHAVLGLAIASNIFYLQEGTRTIIFTLTFNRVIDNILASELANIFTVDFSGKKDWVLGKIQPITNNETSLTGETLTLEVTLTAEQEPIESYHPELPGARLNTNLPVARLHLKDNVLVNGLSAYSYFRNLKLTKFNISTKNIEIQNLLLQNDLSPINPGKPFQPFGPRPVVGSTFYVGSKEIFQKNLSLLTMKVVWQGLPTDLKNHYRGYYGDNDSSKPKFDKFTADVKRLTQHNWSGESLPSEYNLFVPAGDRILVDRTASTPLPGAKIDELTSFNLDTASGFLRFVLKQNFLHEEFPRKYALQTLASAKNFAAGEYVNGAVYEVVTVDGDKKTSTFQRWQPGDTLSTNLQNVAPVILNEPYTPVIQSISLSYNAVADGRDCRLFHLHPFDRFAEVVANDTPDFLPQFTNEGELLIGLANLDPPTSLPLLFQVAQETADTALEKVDVQWHYLKDNTWISLSDRIVSDTTNGLITSGIVNLGIPGDISKQNTTILDPSLHWIKATVPARSGAICQILGVYTQAARVTFTDAGNDPQHLATPLPAGTIAKLAVPIPEIKKVEQPYDSFGGQIKEKPEHFYTRISEHLRHKGRAVSIFDYERLVLEKFPQIYKVRCINHGKVGQTNQLYELVPGAVTLVVIPDLSQRNSTNDLEPKININLLEKIEKYLAGLSSPWVDIRVVNPVYEHIQVECEVQFKPPYNSNFGYYRRDLEQRITQFLTPWTVDKGAEINLGGTMYRSSILNFIEQQYYVDYVVNFQMHHDNQRNVKEAIASTARSVLTSVSVLTTGQTHIIQEAHTIAEQPKLASGILGYESLDNLELG